MATIITVRLTNTSSIVDRRFIFSDGKLPRIARPSLFLRMNQGSRDTVSLTSRFALGDHPRTVFPGPLSTGLQLQRQLLFVWHGSDWSLSCLTEPLPQGKQDNYHHMLGFLKSSVCVLSEMYHGRTTKTQANPRQNDE